MIVEKVREIIWLRQSKWLEINIVFIRQNWNQDLNDFEKNFFKFLNNAFHEKTTENVRNRIKIE